jgi:hypothetical protein
MIGQNYKCVLSHDHPVVRLVRAIKACGLEQSRGICILKNAREAETARRWTAAVEAQHKYVIKAIEALGLPEALRPLAQEAVLHHEEVLRRHERPARPTPAPHHTTEATEAHPRERKARVRVDDEVAQAMKGLTLDEMYAYAQDALGTPQDLLKSRSAHLNNGLKRMWLGNQIRKKLSSGGGK